MSCKPCDIPKTCIDRTEMGHPSADRLIGDGDPALSKKLLDIPEAQREARIQPKGVLDDRRREPTAAATERFHHQMLPAVRPQAHGSSPT